MQKSALAFSGNRRSQLLLWVVSGSPVGILTGIFEEFYYCLLHSINSIRRSSKAPKMKCNKIETILAIIFESFKFCKRSGQQTRSWRIPEPSVFFGILQQVRRPYNKKRQYVKQDLQQFRAFRFALSMQLHWFDIWMVVKSTLGSNKTSAAIFFLVLFLVKQSFWSG